MYIPKDIIELVRERTPIEELVKKYVPTLKKKGKNYLGLCPFHQEKTPSFTVSADKQIFYCFGCHAGGNVFTFISRMERLEFPESVRMLADMAGIAIPDQEHGETHSRTETLINMNTMARDLFHEFLFAPGGKTGLEYLKGRGVSEAAIREFKLGFAPESWNFLTNHLKKKGVDIALAETIGLVSSTDKETGKHYFDRFRNRVMFPICDKNGQVIAFGGRILGAGEQKYVNSPESELYKKRNVLYGLHIARTHIRDCNRAILVEGYLDVIGCHEKGIKNVVAPLGTALTEEQLQLLSRLGKEVVVLFDADAAGKKASLRSLEVARGLNVELKVAQLPETDPFEFVQKKGGREFMTIVDRAVKPVDFRISCIISEHGAPNTIEALREIFTVLKDVDMETERGLYLKKVSGELDLDEQAVRADFRRFLEQEGGAMHPKPSPGAPLEPAEKDFITRSYRDLIKLLCHHPELVEKAVIDFAPDQVPDEATRNVFSKIIEIYNSEDGFTPDKMFDFFPDGSEMRLLNESVNMEYSFENPGSVYTEIYITMKVHDIDTKIKRYADLVKRSNGANVQVYLTEIEVLTREKQKLSHYLYNRGMRT